MCVSHAVLEHSAQQQMYAGAAAAGTDAQHADAYRRDVVPKAFRHAGAAMATMVQCDESADVLQQVRACCSCGWQGCRPQLLLQKLHEALVEYDAIDHACILRDHGRPLRRLECFKPKL
jgi:hypothetical protein